MPDINTTTATVNEAALLPDTAGDPASAQDEHAVDAASDLTDGRLEAIAQDIEAIQATAILHVAERLAEARDIFRYRRHEGGFGGWAERRLRLSRQTIYNLLHVHEQFGGQSESVKYLDTFPASVLYLLAAPSTPEAARTEVIKRAETGEALPAAEVKRVVENHKNSKDHRRARKPKKQQSNIDAVVQLDGKVCPSAVAPSASFEVGGSPVWVVGPASTGEAVTSDGIELTAKVQDDWRTAEPVIEALCAHTAAQIAAAIPPSKKSLIAECAALLKQVADSFVDAGPHSSAEIEPEVVRLPAAEMSGEAEMLDIPDFLRREPA